MTETELINRLRESIVLEGPEAWRSNGYLEDAQRAGWKLVTALKQANEVSQEMGYYREWIDDVRTRIGRLAQLAGPPTEQDLDPIIRVAAALKLPADFVRDRWVPTELARLRGQPVAFANGRVTADYAKPTADPVVDPPAVVVPAPALVSGAAPEPIAQSVLVATPEPPLPEPNGVVPEKIDSPSVVRSFTATPARIRQGESVALAWVVDRLPTVMVDELGAGLSPQGEGRVKPARTTTYTLFDPDKQPLRTVQVEVIPRDRSVVYGVLGALLLIFGFLWYNSAGKSEQKRGRPTESTVAQRPALTETGAAKPYDAIEGEADERGWRRARSNGRWGFIDKDNQWVIQPEYDVVTQFRRGRAIVFKKGRLITINRDGEVVRK